VQDTHRPAERGPLGLTPDELTLLMRINQGVSNRRDRAALVKAIAGVVHGVLPADRITIVIPGSECADVSISFVDGDTQSEDERIPHAAVSTWVARNRQAAIVSSPEQLRERFPTSAQSPIDEGVGSFVVLPLLTADRCLGTLEFMARAESAWDGYSARLLEEIGTIVAAALDNCLAYEQSRGLGDELQALLDVNVAVGRHLERDELFGALASCLRSLLPTERFGIEIPIEGGKLQGHLLTPRSELVEPTLPTVLPAEGTACDWVLQNQRWIVTSSRDELRERFPVTFDVMSQGGMESLVAMPLSSGSRCRGVLFFMAARKGAYEGLRRGLIERVANAVAVALDDCLAHEEVRRLRDQLAAENSYLQEEIRQDHNFTEFVGHSPVLLEVFRVVEQVAPTGSTVLILGETGTGKELIARAIHDRSPRKNRPLVKVNCAAISPGLVESELFGHVKGAFTGALQNRDGRFKLADGGTIFLDEVGELPPETQVRLLRVLQEQEFEPVGSGKTVKVDVRVIAATNRDLQTHVREGKFRADLFYRLHVLPLHLPPLRSRVDDIPALTQFFVQGFAKKFGKHVSQVASETMRRLCAYEWPGNVRELQNVIERAMVLASGPVLSIDESVLPGVALGSSTQPALATARDVDSLSRLAARSDADHTSFGTVTRQDILAVLAQTKWKIDGECGAAKLLKLHPNTLRSRMKKLGIRRTNDVA